MHFFVQFVQLLRWRGPVLPAQYVSSYVTRAGYTATRCFHIVLHTPSMYVIDDGMDGWVCPPLP